MNQLFSFQRISGLGAAMFLVLFMVFQGCKHEPLLPSDPINPPVDTSGNNGNPNPQVNTCDPDTVYFERDILPILSSNCAMSGCHDAATASDGVNLTTYSNIINTADVRAFDPEGSDLYEVITETDPDKLMPPSPNASLTTDQIQLIRKWIMQGALNLTCEDTNCDTANVSFSLDVQPIIQSNCTGCHSGAAPSGGITLVTHNNLQTVGTSGQLVGSITHSAGFTPMPFGTGTQLPQCDIEVIKAWINAGMPNN